MPNYADPSVGGYQFQGGRSEPAVRHVTDLGDGRLFIEGAAAPRRSLWSRLGARLRRGR